MYLYTNIIFRSIDGFGPTAWCRDTQPVSVYRANRRRRRTATEEIGPANPSSRKSSREQNAVNA